MKPHHNPIHRRTTMRRSRAFTLIELLIVVGILMLITGTGMALQNHLAEQRVWQEEHMNAEDTLVTLGQRWRDDVALARAIDVQRSADATSCTIRLTQGTPAAPRTVTYHWQAGGAIMRSAPSSANAPAAPHRLATQVASCDVVNEGRLWRLAWRIEATDGLSRRDWDYTVLATPLEVAP